MMTSSFSDMSDLLRRVNRADEDLEKTKDNIVKSILNVRRGSRKGKSASREDPGNTSSDSKSGRSLPYRKTVSDRPVTASAVKQKSKLKALTVEQAVNGQYQERNIDEAIENRSRLEKDSICEEEETAGEGESQSSSVPTSRRETSSVDEGNSLDLAVDAMRRQREEQIYTARRIFITGGSNAEKTGNTTPEKSNQETVDEGTAEYSEKLDGLVRHTRHLNLSGCTDTAIMDVLSPETREKIRRLQTDGQLLKLKEQRQNVQLKKIESARQRVERAWIRAKADAESEDYLDVFANDPVHTDALSVTSDYSTTSSAAGGDGSSIPQAPGSGVSKSSTMSHSCNGALPSSDYSSTGSPLTPHLPQKMDPLNHSQASVNSTGSDNVGSNSEGSIYDRRRLRHVVPVANRTSRTPPTSASLVAREKAWYELESEEIAAVKASEKLRQSSASPSALGHGRNPGAAVTFRDDSAIKQSIGGDSSETDQNRNGSANAGVGVGAKVQPATGPPAVQRVLSGSEKPMSRISQKIRFRSKSSSADKRKDPRRHTLTDLEHLKTALFGGNNNSSTVGEGKTAQKGSIHKTRDF